MGQVKRATSPFFTKVSKQLSRLLEAEEREAVLGDLAEEGTGPFTALSSLAGLALRRLVSKAQRRRVSQHIFAAACAVDAEEAKSWPEWAIPLAFGLIAAACVAGMLVPTQHQTFSWTGLISRSAWLLLGAALAAVTTVYLVHRGFRDYLGRPASTLLACAWSTAIWLPLLLLLWTQRALWVVLTPIPIAAILASFTKRRHDAFRNSSATELTLVRTRPPIFAETQSLNARAFPLLPLLCAVLLDAAGIAGVAGQLPLTSSLVILATACLAWACTPDQSVAAEGVRPPLRVSLLPCFLLTCLALTPFLRAGLSDGGLSGLVLARPLMRVPHIVDPGIVYPGVVLMAPPLPKRKLIASPPKTLFSSTLRIAKPLTIPFDGAYWYFQDPETQPRTDSRVKRGNPLKDHVSSGADRTPLRMEAHQRLGAQIAGACCRTLSVALINADNRPGLIQVEAKLRDITRAGTTTVSLGVLPIRSSMDAHISLGRPQVNETLRFTMRQDAAFQFNEISLVFKLARERNLAGARVQVVNFTLQP